MIAARGAIVDDPVKLPVSLGWDTMKRLIGIFLLCVIALPALAERRVALLIGNNAYDAVEPLAKAVADAEAMAARLSDVGFEVILATDVTRRDFNLRISQFTGYLGPGDTAFIFFAGHGVEIDGENYLLPTDIVVPDAASSDFVRSESIPLSGLLDRVRRTGARATLAVIDACRNNPFPQRAGRSIGGTRGLARLAAPEGAFVMFSAGAGQLALDQLNAQDDAENSVFTRLLLPKIGQPGLELRELISDLRVEVRDLARSENHAQFPAYYDELLGDFYFTKASAVSSAGVATDPLQIPKDIPELSNMGAVVTTKSVDEVMAALEAAVLDLGGQVYGRIDPHAVAARGGEAVTMMRALWFSDPALDAIAIRENKLSALLLPLKVLVFEHNGQTVLAYEHPTELFDDLTFAGNTDFLDLYASMLWAVTETAAR